MISLILFILSVFCIIYYGMVIMAAGTNVAFAKFWPFMAMLLALIAVFISGNFYANLPSILHLILRILAVGVILCILIILIILLTAKSDADVESDYIIVPGANIRGQKPGKALKARIDAAYKYLDSHSKCHAILSGYQNQGADMPQGKCMQNELKKRGIEGYRLLVEPYARTTEENLRFAKDYMMMTDPVVTIITGQYHLARCKKEARKQGYKKVYGIGVKSDRVLAIHYYVREIFAYVKHIL